MAKRAKKFTSTRLDRWLNAHTPTYIQELVHRRWFKYAYLFVASIILALTTIYWSILGGRLQNSNADELINSYLFQNAQTFHQASLPGAHTFLLKWPLFYFIKCLPREFLTGIFPKEFFNTFIRYISSCDVK